MLLNLKVSLNHDAWIYDKNRNGRKIKEIIGLLIFDFQTLDDSEWNGLFFLTKNPEIGTMFSKVQMYCRTISRLP